MLVVGRSLPRFILRRHLSLKNGNGNQVHPESARVRLVDKWKPPKLDFKVNIEVATEKDADLTYDFMITDSRTSEPMCTSMEIQEAEIPIILKVVNDRSIGSGLTLLMFKDDDKELIGIRMTSVGEIPKDVVKKEFEILPDYKELIDSQPSKSRKEQRIIALVETMYDYAPQFLPPGPYFCMELIGIKKQYRMGNLSTAFVKEMYKLAASKGIQYGEVLCTAKASTHVCKKLGMKTVLEMPYSKFLDNGEACFENTPDGSTGAQLMIGNLEEMGYTINK